MYYSTLFKFLYTVFINLLIAKTYIITSRYHICQIHIYRYNPTSICVTKLNL